MVLLILGQPLWIYHSISQSIYLLHYGEESHEAINGLWLYADMLISIMLFLLSIPFVYLAYKAGEAWIKRKFIIWIVIAFISPLVMIVFRFAIEMKFAYFSLLQVIPAIILFILPIFWTIKYWYIDKPNNEGTIEKNTVKTA